MKMPHLLHALLESFSQPPTFLGNQVMRGKVQNARKLLLAAHVLRANRANMFFLTWDVLNIREIAQLHATVAVLDTLSVTRALTTQEACKMLVRELTSRLSVSLFCQTC